MSLQWTDVCQAYTGYSSTVVYEVASKLNMKPDHVFVAASQMHLNISGEAFRFVIGPYIGRICSSENIRMRIVGPVFRKNLAHGNMVDLTRRLYYRDPIFIDCTFIIDGVPVFCRGAEACYNDKHGDKFYSFQVAVMIDGCPLAWSGPFEGKQHDATSIDGLSLFPVKENELGFADLAYVANRRLFCQKSVIKTTHLLQRTIYLTLSSEESATGSSDSSDQ